MISRVISSTGLTLELLEKSLGDPDIGTIGDRLWRARGNDAGIAVADEILARIEIDRAPMEPTS